VNKAMSASHRDLECGVEQFIHGNSSDLRPDLKESIFIHTKPKNASQRVNVVRHCMNKAVYVATSQRVKVAVREACMNALPWHLQPCPAKAPVVPLHQLLT
jgi:hypothetical protein